jgi:cardiolipin synthase (CMP-forming)
MTLKALPNLLCVLRMLLVYPTALGILEGRYGTVLVLFVLAAFTDGVDGFLARRFGWTTELGRILDPLADKLLMVGMFLCMSVAGLVPWWLTALVLLRDLVIVSGAIAYRVLFGPLHGQPTASSKFNTLCQVLMCLAVVSQAAYGWPARQAIVALGALLLVTTAISGLDYVLTYSRRAAVATRARSHAAAG